MKKFYAPLMALALSVTLIACGGDKEEESEEGEGTEEPDVKVCTFSYDNATTKLYWEAYKHTAKNPVNGEMTSVEVSPVNAEANTIAALINGATFKVMTESVDSKDTLRDGKLKRIFFGAMENAMEITGSVALDMDNSSNLSGEGNFKLMLNGVEADLPMTYKVEDGTVKMTANMDFNNWNGADALAALGAACEEKHTGDDGEVKMWPNAKITVTTQVTKNCQ